MKFSMVIILLISANNLFAQNNSANGKMPRYGIHLTTMNDNMLKGLLLQVKDTSVVIYPGKFKEWKNHMKYNPVEFGYSNIQEIRLKRKNNSLKGMLIGGGIGVSAIAISFLVSKGNTKDGGYQLTIPLLPLGMIMGAMLGNKSGKKYYINESGSLFNEFKKRKQ